MCRQRARATDHSGGDDAETSELEMVQSGCFDPSWFIGSRRRSQIQEVTCYRTSALPIWKASGISRRGVPTGNRDPLKYRWMCASSAIILSSKY
jgi:hypothetical protein